MKYKKLIISLVGFLIIIATIAGICFGLQLSIKDGVLSVGKSIFYPYEYQMDKEGVTLTRYDGEEEEVVIPETIWGKSVITIGRECFEDNNTIKKVILNSNINEIGAFSFDDCDSLKEVLGATCVENIDAYAFSGAENLEYIEVGNSIKNVGDGAFSGCKSLKTLCEQKNIKSIGRNAFVYSVLDEFEFNKDAEIASGAFDGTPWLQNQPEEFVIYGDGNLIGYNGTDTIIEIPTEVKRINGGAFEKISNVEIYVPETVTEIGDLVFIEGENIRIYIPATVDKVGDEQEHGYTIVNNDAEVTIITTAGSTAEAHAIKYDIPYEIVDAW